MGSSSDQIMAAQKISQFWRDFGQLCNLITGCAVAQHCCKGDEPFQWEMPKFDSPYLPNPLISKHQNWQVWLRPPPLSTCQIWLESVHWGPFYKYLKYNDFVTFCTFPFLPFPFLFLFLSSPTAKMAEPILTHDSSYDVVSRKEVPFGGLDDEK